MKRKKKPARRKKGFPLFLLGVFVVLMTLCSLSYSITGELMAAVGLGGVEFASGEKFRKDSESISVVLQRGETALLSEFEALKSADFSGSICLDEILEWQRANPSVSVRYTVNLPTGQTLANDETRLELPGIDADGIYSILPHLKYLPAINSVNLGSARSVAEILPSDAVSALRAELPGADLSYSFFYAGKEYTAAAESIDLSELKSAGLEDALTVIGCMPALKEIFIGDNTRGQKDLSWDDIGSISAAAPGAVIDYSFTAFGMSLSLADEELNFRNIQMTDEGAAVRKFLPYMRNCKTLDMDYTGVSTEAMAKIREDFPNIDVIWRIWFGERYGVRTDVERILASKPSIGGPLNDYEVDKLKYCTKVKYLDLGHNEGITDISFMANMPDLEVLIIAMSRITDLSPLQNCMKLEYMEIQTTLISDLSPLADKTELRHLNIGECYNLTDISPLYGLSELKRLWIGAVTPITADQVAHMQSCAPKCTINTTADGQEDGPTQGWKYYYLQTNVGWDYYHWTERYSLLHLQFGYGENQFSFYWMDEYSGHFAPPEYAGKYHYVDPKDWVRLMYDPDPP